MKNAGIHSIITWNPTESNLDAGLVHTEDVKVTLLRLVEGDTHVEGVSGVRMRVTKMEM